MAEPTELRKATLTDLAVLLDLSVNTFYPAFAALNTEENMREYMARAFSEEQLAKELADPDCLFYLAHAGDRPCGYLKLNFAQAQTDLNDPDSLEVQRIYVLPEFQGVGIGEQMVQKAISVAAEYRLKYIWLGVWEKNPAAIRFYRRHGFVVAGSHPFPFGDEIQTDLIMKLVLE
mgnify:CR=1 FL=1